MGVRQTRGLRGGNCGGAPLLGVKGISIISHGKSDARAIKNAIKAATRAVDSRMNEHIGRRLQAAAASLS